MLHMTKQEEKMLIQIDKINGHLIQKVTTPSRKFTTYQVVKEGNYDAKQVIRFNYLSAAREHARKVEPCHTTGQPPC